MQCLDARLDDLPNGVAKGSAYEAVNVGVAEPNEVVTGHAGSSSWTSEGSSGLSVRDLIAYNKD